MSAPAPIGLLAGAGRFPILFAIKARELGIPVICIGVAGMADPALRDVCHEFRAESLPAWSALHKAVFDDPLAEWFGDDMGSVPKAAERRLHRDQVVSGCRRNDPVHH